MELTSRTILITGGATGIGYALAKQFVANQNIVIICGRSQEKLDLAKSRLPSIETIRCDINCVDDLNNLVSFLSGKFPNLDTLINNAGIQQKIDLTNIDFSEEDINNEISTNLTAHINITLRLYSLLSANKSPVIVFTGSALGIVPKYEMPVYSAAKAGIHSFVQSLRHQTKLDGVHVYEIFPELVNTPMTRHRINESMMDPEDFATAVIKLLVADNQNIYIGRTKTLNLLNRLLPGVAKMVMNKPSTV